HAAAGRRHVAGDPDAGDADAGWRWGRGGTACADHARRCGGGGHAERGRRRRRREVEDRDVRGDRGGGAGRWDRGRGGARRRRWWWCEDAGGGGCGHRIGDRQRDCADGTDRAGNWIGCDREWKRKRQWERIGGGGGNRIGIGNGGGNWI